MAAGGCVVHACMCVWCVSLRRDSRLLSIPFCPIPPSSAQPLPLFQTLEKAWGVNLMDYGGVIMAAKDYTQQPSQVLQYTCQEGLPGQWQSFTFLDRDIIVWGVVTEPGETSVQSLWVVCVCVCVCVCSCTLTQ